jgi:hypothetical protein
MLADATDAVLAAHRDRLWEIGLRTTLLCAKSAGYTRAAHREARRSRARTRRLSVAVDRSVASLARNHERRGARR